MAESKNPEPWHPNWAYVGAAELDFLLSEAKESLEGSIALGINSDQRSAALAGVFGAGAFALFTVSATIFSGQNHAGIFLIGAMFVGFLLLIAAGLCAWAARPGDFFVSGYEPRLLFSAASDKTWMQRYTIEDIQVRIEKNRKEIDREANLVKWAIRLAMVALIATFFFVMLGLCQIQQSQKITRPSSAASSAQAGAVEMTLWAPVSWTENCYCSSYKCSPYKLRISAKNTMSYTDKQLQ